MSSRVTTASSTRTGTATGRSGRGSTAVSAEAEKLRLKEEALMQQRQQWEYKGPVAEQLRAEIRGLRMEMEQELKMINESQLVKEKAEEFLDLKKKEKESEKFTLREKLREKQDIEEKFEFELSIYKNKVKNLLHEQQLATADLRIEIEHDRTRVQTDQRQADHVESMQVRTLKQNLKDHELQQWDFVKNLKAGQEKSLVQLREEYDQKMIELKQHYEKKQRVAREEEDTRRKEEVQRVELIKNTHIADLMAKHKRKFDKIKKYYSDITHANLELIKSLKEELADMKKREMAVLKALADIRRINKRLTRPLQKNRMLIEGFLVQLRQYREDSKFLSIVRDRLSQSDISVKNLEWENEVTLQNINFAKGQRDELKGKLQQGIFIVQQKSKFQNLLKEKKLKAITVDLEKTESALSEVLSHTNFPADVASTLHSNLEEILLSKNSQIQQLEDSLQEAIVRYAQTIQLYESKLTEYQIPVEELGFKPSKTI